MYPINLAAFCLMAIVGGITVTYYLNKSHDTRGVDWPLFGAKYRSWNRARRAINYLVAVPLSAFFGSEIWNLATPNMIPTLLVLPTLLAIPFFCRAGLDLPTSIASKFVQVLALVGYLAIALIMASIMFSTIQTLTTRRDMPFYDVVFDWQLIVNCLYSIGFVLAVLVIYIRSMRKPATPTRPLRMI